MKLSISYLLPIFLVFLLTIQKPAFAVQKSYVVLLSSGTEYGSRLSAGPEAVTSYHLEFLSSFLQSDAKAEDAIIYSYNKIFDGFAALLHEEEAEELAKHPNVVSVFKNQFKKLHTTNSWKFLGLETHNGAIPENAIWKTANFGEDTIIATLDTGVWPESRSFADDNLSPIPKKYKGACANENDPTFHCNRKLIGARYYYKGYEELLREYNITFNYTKSPRDTEGHGSHTLSTAAGRPVPGVNIEGFGNGTAVGGSPRARVATYKVCWPVVSEETGGCSDSDILAALEDAINDKVDVISMSLGGPPSDYFNDSIAIGSFHAVTYGIPVIASAGNSGPELSTVSNLSPWIFTVGASTTDRVFVTDIKLGNNIILKGASLAQKGLHQPYPLVTGVDARVPTAKVSDAAYCLSGTVDRNKAKGKILVCQRGQTGLRLGKAFEAARVGAVWLIIVNDIVYGLQTFGDKYAIPTSHLSFSDGQVLFAYLNSTKSPVATIASGVTEYGAKPAPFVVDFSSRGPNSITPEIIKPDIIAPGLRVIAAFSEDKKNPEKAPYALLDGTSMACPHITGVVGLLRSIYPHWSSSAIKSAILTTAWVQDNRREPLVDFANITATPFDYGAGHVNPNGAVDPGLVYDLKFHDYLNFLCAIGYNKQTIKLFAKHPYSCPDSVSVTDLNYPTISLPGFTGHTTVIRRLKNVGQPGKYIARVRAPAGTSIAVEPNTLNFTEKGQELEYKLIVTGEVSELPQDYSFGYIVWSDGKHDVRSYISVKALSTLH